MALTRFYKTVRGLRLRQAVAQVRHRLRAHLEASAPTRNAPARPELLPASDQPFIPPLQPRGGVEAVRAGKLTFLNRTESVGWPPVWDVPSAPKLWLYNLHYHDFLWSLPFESGIAVALDWISNNPVSRNNTGWEAYPASLRIQNWCTYFFGMHRESMLQHPSNADNLWNSLFHQISWLEKNLEWHLLGNHLLENAAALSLAGSTFGGASGGKWLNAGLRLLQANLDDLVLPDGGHVERSPMYHARLCLVLENLVRTGNARVIEVTQGPLQRARDALAVLCHPDQNIALLNDSAFRIYPSPAELGISRQDSGSFKLPDSGYYGSITDEDHYVVCDAGAIGPDYQPGHAHADTLSFELSFHGLRFFIDSGVFGYEQDEWRPYARSTRAHNTIEINRMDQSDLWSAFRVGRKAYPRHVVHEMSDEGFSLEAEHTGYERLPGRPVHRRRFSWHKDGFLMVRDRVTGRRDVWMRSSLHLHPDVRLTMREDGSILLEREEVRCTLKFAGSGRLNVEKSWYFPEFGRRVANNVLVLTARGSDLTSGFCLAAGDQPLGFNLEGGATVGAREYTW